MIEQKSQQQRQSPDLRLLFQFPFRCHLEAQHGVEDKLTRELHSLSYINKTNTFTTKDLLFSRQSLITNLSLRHVTNSYRRTLPNRNKSHYAAKRYGSTVLEPRYGDRLSSAHGMNCRRRPFISEGITKGKFTPSIFTFSARSFKRLCFHRSWRMHCGMTLHRLSHAL